MKKQENTSVVIYNSSDNFCRKRSLDNMLDYFSLLFNTHHQEPLQQVLYVSGKTLTMTNHLATPRLVRETADFNGSQKR